MRKANISLLVLLFALPSVTFAHTGIGTTTGFMHGFGHPIRGLDHILAMVAVGLWASQIGRRSKWIVPCIFVGIMCLGGVLGFSGVSIPFVEEGILVSILVLGVFIAGAFKLPLIYSSLIVGLFAIFHGYAHGTEIPASISAASYTFGFALATAILHIFGIGLGVLMQKANLQVVNRIAGGAIAFSGILLAVS